MPLRLGTRASALAQWQAEWVAAQLRASDIEVDLVPISTTGDRRQQTIRDIGGQGIFTKEIQRALVDGRIDVAVHSLKDLPTVASPGIVLATVPERGAPGDVFVCPQFRSLAELPRGASVGTGSLRRRAQLLYVRRDLQIKEVRGNVETRLRKLDQGNFDALVLAEAGLRRLGLAHRITEMLPLRIMMPAIGQGALGLETRSDDPTTYQIVSRLNHPPTHAAVLAERALLSALEGGCSAPVAALGHVEKEQLTLAGRVIAHDGLRMIEATRTRPSSEAEALGLCVAEDLLAQGAGELIRTARKA